jgi:hypothetical protein
MAVARPNSRAPNSYTNALIALTGATVPRTAAQAAAIHARPVAAAPSALDPRPSTPIAPRGPTVGALAAPLTAPRTPPETPVFDDPDDTADDTPDDAPGNPWLNYLAPPSKASKASSPSSSSSSPSEVAWLLGGLAVAALLLLLKIVNRKS